MTPNEQATLLNVSIFGLHYADFSFHGVPDLTMAFRIVSSLRMHATKATFFTFPTAKSR